MLISITFKILLKFTFLSLACVLSFLEGEQISNNFGQKVTVIGAGNFGTAIANRISLNTHSNVKLWIYDEVVDGKHLSDIINETHENTKYLPGIKLSHNVVAKTNLTASVEDADYIILVLPHQHMASVLRLFSGKLKADAIVVSMTKGLKFSELGPELMSDIIAKEWNCKNIAVIMGANVASEVAQNQIVDATVSSADPQVAERVSAIFNCNCFRTQTCVDMVTVELCGALKNVIALGAGFCDALNLGHSSKAALLRQGLNEMGHLCKLVSPSTFSSSTLLESCGFPDLVASSYGGRNRLCAEEFAKRTLSLIASKKDTVDMPSHESMWTSIEQDLLGGMHVAGLDTCCQVVSYLNHLEKSRVAMPVTFGLIRRIHGIAVNNLNPQTLFDW